MNKKIILALSAILFSTLIYTGCKKSSDDTDTNAIATCTDGIMNQNETGIDCGGSCTACPTCSDGILNQGETGIDCGGPCDACPSMSANVDVGTNFVADTFGLAKSVNSGITGYRLYGKNKTTNATVDIYLNAPSATPITSGILYNFSPPTAGIQFPWMKYNDGATLFVGYQGTIYFTKLDLVTKKATGTFSLKGRYTITGGGFVDRTLTDGEFTNNTISE